MNQRTLVALAVCGVCALAGVVGAADVFLEATRPDFQKISLGVVSIENNGGPDWLGGRLEEVLKKDVKRSLVFELMDLPSLGIKVRDVGNGVGNGSKAIFKQAAENGVSVLVWGKAGLKKGRKRRRRQHGRLRLRQRQRRGGRREAIRRNTFRCPAHGPPICR